MHHQRKLKSQTSDGMGRSRGGKSQRRERVRRKKAGARKGRKVAKHYVFFQWFVAPGGRQVGSLKRRMRSRVARWEMKNCTPLCRGAHVQVKMLKTPQPRSTFGSWDVENCTPLWREAHLEAKNLTVSDHFWKLRRWKSARCCGAKHISSVKNRRSQNTFEVRKWLWVASTFPKVSQNVRVL